MTRINGAEITQAIDLPEHPIIGNTRLIRAACNAALVRLGANPRLDFNQHYKEGARPRSTIAAHAKIVRVKRSELSRFQK